MTETTADFIELEQLYKNEPRAYRRKVLGLISLGYLYVGLAVILIVGFFLGGTVLFATGTLSLLWVDNFLKAGIPALIVAFLMVRALFVRLPPPDGLYLEGQLKQKILNFFEDVRVAAGGKPIDEVVITDELNAAVQQMPRYGLFGPTTNYLILGVPLLQLMTTDEVRAVIAHEFGHLSHEHGRMGARVYRLNQTLVRAAMAIEEKTKSGVRGWSYRSLNWFYRRFNKVTFAMRRGQEYEADALAARVTSAEAISSALCRLYALERPLGSYWDRVWRRPRDLESNGGEKPHSQMQPGVRDYFNADAASSAVEAALQNQTDFADTHPCLRDRLAALDNEKITGFSLANGALNDIFTSAERERFLLEADRAWREATTPNWRAAHERFAESERERAELESRRRTLGFDELARLANIEEHLDGLPAARKTYEDLATAHPDNAYAQFHFGRALFNDDFGRAEVALLKSVDLELEYAPSAADYLHLGYEKDGRPDEFEKFRVKLDEYKEMCDTANAEREMIGLEDELVAVELGAEFAAALQEHLTGYPEIKTVYLVEKVVKTFRDDRVYLLAYDINTYHDNVESNTDNWLARVSDDIAGRFPPFANAFRILLGKKHPWLERLATIDGAVVYERSGKPKRTPWQFLKLAYGWVILLGLALFLIAWLLEKL